ncbi:MAG: glycoside hydrolase family 3 N-terminal domain-containing protein [Niveispirillum sp.]|uniref:glycoside hydrolase family 3 N-terminal domain-containing protein n=1 Tax=Niveispirillum sp. TaxID=1917217 RepID=UPI004036345C
MFRLFLLLTAMSVTLSGGSVAQAKHSPTSGVTPDFRDLNRNLQLDPYEDRRLTPDQRADDLVQRMTLEEKVGAMMHGTLPGRSGFAGISREGYDHGLAAQLIRQGNITSFLTRVELTPARMAEENNAIQRIAAEGRLGIPVTISTDPRNHFQAMAGASVAAKGFSQWPEPLGFGAIGDAELVRRFGGLVAVEYRAVGIHMALSPQADLATEPRWSRATGTFGSDPRSVSRLAGAYVEGFQGSRKGVTSKGVATVVKHWVGYGAQPEGFDAHNYYGRVAKLDRQSFTQHIAAFRGAFAARSAGIMPGYPIIEGVKFGEAHSEPVGAGYNRNLIQGLLRDTQRYRGLIVSDWAITNDCLEVCRNPTAESPQSPMAIAMPWGVEALSREERFAKAVAAGIDQFGGVDDPAPLLAAVRTGRVSESRLDASVRRIMVLKFQLGLFDHPYVDPAHAATMVGAEATQAEADAAQRAAAVLLRNDAGLLPLNAPGTRVWLYGVNEAAARAVGLTVVTAPQDADLAIVRAGTPFETLNPHHFFGSRQHEGRLDYRDGDAAYEALKQASRHAPTLFAVDMDRPAILSNIQDKARGIIALFGASDAALLDLVVGKAEPRGRLPFELPGSMAAVEGQDPARPDDSEAPLYGRGAGLTY